MVEVVGSPVWFLTSSRGRKQASSLVGPIIPEQSRQFSGRKPRILSLGPHLIAQLMQLCRKFANGNI